MPREGLQEQPLLRRMFENEVQITLGFEHPNTVAAFEGHPTGPSAFLALEYCSGGTLDQLLLERGPLPLEQAVRLILQVAAGLEHSHTRQVLHRDVKPANVFITADGSAKLGDLGTGMFLSESSSDQVGTAFYMAPEIFEAERPSVSSDVYSLGILAFEVLSGARPFVGSTFQDLMVAHTSGLPRNLGNYRKDLPHKVASVVSRTMSRDRSRRYRTVSQFIAEFTAAAGHTAADGRTQTGRASRMPKSEEADGVDQLKHTRSRNVFPWLRKRD